MTPKVSVVIPCYGVEEYLPHLFEDLRNQDFNDFEMIFVNDGGGQALSRIIHDFEDKDNRAVAIDKENGGVSSARNSGIKQAKGEWLMFVDPDDCLEKRYIRCMYEAVDGSDSVLAVAGITQLYTQTNTKVDHTLDMEGRDIPMNIAYWHFPPLNSPYNKIYKTEFIRSNGLAYPEDVTYMEDEHFCLKLYSLIDKCCLVKNCGYIYMMRDKSSALSRYHRNVKRYMQISTEGKRKLMLKFGKTEEEIRAYDASVAGINIYVLTINLFKKGTDLSFWQAYRYIKHEIYGDKELMALFGEHSWANDKTVVKINNLLVRLRCPLLTAMVFKSLFWMKYHRRH